MRAERGANIRLLSPCSLQPIARPQLIVGSHALWNSKAELLIGRLQIISAAAIGLVRRRSCCQFEGPGWWGEGPFVRLDGGGPRAEIDFNLSSLRAPQAGGTSARSAERARSQWAVERVNAIGLVAPQRARL